MDTLSLLLLRVTFTRKLNSWDVTNYNILKPTEREGWSSRDWEGKGSKGWEVRVESEGWKARRSSGD